MRVTTLVVASRVRDEVEHAEPERGARYWSAMELTGERWFQIETCSREGGASNVKTYITTDFIHARRLLHELRGNLWSSLRMYARLPLVSEKGFVFENVSQAFKTTSSEYIYCLENGLLLFDAPSSLSGDRLQLCDAERVYSRY
jgi:hypothetical protein